MSSPFPGMDPYLEHPRLWPDLHNRAIAELARTLGPAVRPRYYLRLEERTWLVPHDPDATAVPDLTIEPAAQPRGFDVREPAPPPYGRSMTVSVPVPERIRETWLRVHDAASGEVITVIELLSHANKRRGRDRDRYERKRLAIFDSSTSFVEIDLLRAGAPMPVSGRVGECDYRVLVSRGEHRPRSTLHAFTVRNALPLFLLPLRPGDDEPEVRLRETLDVVYDTAGYDLALDYRSDPKPPLAAADAAWADALLREAGKR